MGNRSNVYIQDGYVDGVGVYLYSHWGGRVHLQCALDALQTPIAQNRWGDSQYLTRIIVQTVLDRNGLSETGFGVSATRGDNEHPILVIDCKNQTVALVPEGCERERIPDGWKFSDAHKLDGFTSAP